LVGVGVLGSRGRWTARSQGGSGPRQEPAPAGAARSLQGGASAGAWPGWADPYELTSQPCAPTAAKTAAMTAASYRRKTTGLEDRPRGQPLLDRSGRSAHNYGSASQASIQEDGAVPAACPSGGSPTVIHGYSRHSQQCARPGQPQVRSPQPLPLQAGGQGFESS